MVKAPFQNMEWKLSEKYESTKYDAKMFCKYQKQTEITPDSASSLKNMKF